MSVQCPQCTVLAHKQVEVQNNEEESQLQVPN